MMDNISGSRDKVLFTPGPLTTSQTVRLALLNDHGTWDKQFNCLVASIRKKLLNVAQVDPAKYTLIPLQGCGSYGLEAVLTSTVPPSGKSLILANGAYGKRVAKMAKMSGLQTIVLEFPENTPVRPNMVKKALEEDKNITHVFIVHCETTSGLLNPIKEIGSIVHKFGANYVVDAMSSFGGIAIDFNGSHIDYLVSSANKCIEGVPGFCFVFANISKLLCSDGLARSLSFDLLDQYLSFEKDGKFRFTPPTHVLAAFNQALDELEAEGGITARAKRYAKNHQTLIDGMRKLGFKEFISPENQSYIITSFMFPESDNFNFEEFYTRLSNKGYIIYPGKISDFNCFRIGTIGRIFETDINDLLAAIKSVCSEMDIFNSDISEIITTEKQSSRSYYTKL